MNYKYEVADLKTYYNQYILTTIESKYSSTYKIVRYTANICRIMNLQYILKDKNIFLNKESFEKVVEIFENGKKYYDGELQLYSTKEVNELTNSKNIVEAGKANIVEIASIIGGECFFYKEEIDKIVEIINSTYTISEALKIIREKSNFKDIDKATIKNYMEKYLYTTNTIENPIDKKNRRILKKDIDVLIEHINRQYIPKGKANDIYQYIFKYKDKYNVIILDNFDTKQYIDYTKLKQLYKKYNKVCSCEKVIRYTVILCSTNKIQCFTNKNLDSIYIKKDDLDNYKEAQICKHSVIKEQNQYKKQDECKNISFREYDLKQYYSNKEVQDIFKIKNTRRISEYCGSIIVGAVKYIRKDKIDELLEIKQSTISITDIAQITNTNWKSVRRAIEKLNIEYKNSDTYSLLGNGWLIRNEDAQLIIDHLKKVNELDEAITEYEKFKIKIRDVKINKNIPKTLKAFDSFACERLNENQSSYMLGSLERIYKDILLTLNKELMDSSEEFIVNIVNLITLDVDKREFVRFIKHCQRVFKIKFTNSYEVKGSVAKESKEAYNLSQWMQFAHVLFDTQTEAFRTNLEKAITNRNYAMAWLYCAFHYVCGWRAKDIMEQIPIPKLELEINMNEEQLLEAIKNEEFSIGMAQIIVNNMMLIIQAIDKKPSKIKKEHLYIVIDNNYVYVIGLLIALCEIHRRNAEKDNRKLVTNCLITEKATRKSIHIGFWKDEYTKIFKNEYFQNNRATKTYMIITQIISQKKGWGDGYYLASVERGHTLKKNTDIAQTTQVYLDSINKSNDIDKITYALSERGTFGFISHQLMRIIEKEKFNELDILEQNSKIQELLLIKPTEIERIVKNFSHYNVKMNEVLKELMQMNKEGIKDLLIKIALGETPSKMEHSQCLLKAIDKTKCFYPERTDCIGCIYLIPEMYFLLIFNRKLSEVLGNINNSKNKFDSQRYSFALKEAYLPILSEAISTFGKERVSAFININNIQETIERLYNENKLVLE